MANINEQEGALGFEETLNKSEAFFLKYKKAIIVGVLAAIVVVAGVVVYKQYVSAPREDKASTALAKGQEYFQQELFEKALNGDGAGYTGFVKVADDFSNTDAGNLANLYAGLCYAQLGKWTEAAKYLEQYDGPFDMLRRPARACARGFAYALRYQLDMAVNHLKNAAKKADNNSLSPTFLIQAGEILESQGKAAEALELYKEVKEKYMYSMQYQTIDKYIERASK